MLNGFGIGLRTEHYRYILETTPSVDWFEILIDNYLHEDPGTLRALEFVSRNYPVAFHATGMSTGSCDPLNYEYLNKIKKLVQRYRPAWVSDHLCWVSYNGTYLHDLIPLPYTDEAIRHTAIRIREIQEFLECPFLIENVSTYITHSDSSMDEAQFLTAVASEAGCRILLDVNNVYVTCYNNQSDPQLYLASVPVDMVAQFHLAGYEDCGNHLLDTHGAAISEPVWQLFEAALQRFGPRPTLIERDQNIPSFEILLAEARRAGELMRAVF